MNVGERLQAIRKQKGLSQRELAKRAGVTNSTVSMIEKNSVSPSISSLKKVLDGLPMTLVEFFSADMEPQNRTQFFYRADELPSLPSGAVSMRLVGQAHPGRDITFLDETYPPGTGTGHGDEMYHHTGQETGMVIEGHLELTVEGEVVVLAPGDSYYFDSNRPHRFRNPFGEPARLISATTPANF